MRIYCPISRTLSLLSFTPTLARSLLNSSSHPRCLRLFSLVMKGYERDVRYAWTRLSRAFSAAALSETYLSRSIFYFVSLDCLCIFFSRSFPLFPILLHPLICPLAGRVSRRGVKGPLGEGRQHLHKVRFDDDKLASLVLGERTLEWAEGVFGIYVSSFPRLVKPYIKKLVENYLKFENIDRI